MSWFVKILKCILCVEDEERPVSTQNWSKYDYHRIADVDSQPRTATRNYNYAQETTNFGTHNNWHQTSLNLPCNWKRETSENNLLPNRNEVFKSSTRDLKPSSVKSPPVTTEPTGPLICEKNVVRQKPYNLPLSSSADALQSSKVNQQIKNVTEQNFPNHVLSVSSQRTQPPFKLDSYVCSLRATSITTKSSPPSISEKSIVKSSTSDLKPSSVKSPSVTTETTRPLVLGKILLPKQPNILPVSSSSDALQTSKVNQQTKNVTEQNFPNHVLSPSSQRIQPPSKLDSYVCSLKATSITTKSSPPSISEKSSKTGQKPNDSHLLSSPGRNSAHRDTSKLTHYQKPSCDGCSATSKPFQSSTKLSLVSGVSEPLSSVSGTEKPLSSLKKDHSSTCPLPGKPHSRKAPPLSTKPTVYQAPSSSTSQRKNTDYVWVEKSMSSTYVFSEDIKSLIEKDIVPGVLKMPLSISTYKDYFYALLYAEDCHLEKWEGFEMKNVSLELHDATIYTRKGKLKQLIAAKEKDEKTFVAFEMDKVLTNQEGIGKVPERRPFLLSRDFVSVKPSSRNIKPFQGIIYRVVKSNLVLAEFGEDFLSQHQPVYKYDVKFSFNRICLKRAHQAITAASDTLFRNFLFPEFAPSQELPSSELLPTYKFRKEALAILLISRLQGAPPYLVEGPISVKGWPLSRTGVVIVEAVLRICRRYPSNRILVCAPSNNSCDVLMRGLRKEMSESDVFRANAAFREIDGVPEDILPSCLYESEMDLFACPSLDELEQYKVILSTFMSSFRLRDEGLKAGCFSHIFLVDVSSATEPETLVPLANFATADTVVVVTGAPKNHSGWVRSWIARQYGLRTSYHERLRNSKLYNSLDPRVISCLEDDELQSSNESYSSLPHYVDRMSHFL